MDTKSEGADTHQVDNSNETEIQQKTIVELLQQPSDSVNEIHIKLIKERDDLLTKVEDLRSLNARLGFKTSSIEEELDITNKTLELISEDRDKVRHELNSLQQRNIKLLEETINIKSIMLKKEEELKALNVELSSKKQQLLETKNKEIQIRRIAKKYKDSFNSLKHENEQREVDIAANYLKEQSSSTDNSSCIAIKMEPDTGSDDLEACQKTNILTENQKRISVVSEAIDRTDTGDLQKLTVSDVLKRWEVLDIKIKEIFEQDAVKQRTITQLTSETEKQKQIIESVREILHRTAFNKTSTIPEQSINSCCDENDHKASSLATSLTAPTVHSSFSSGSSSSSLQGPQNHEDVCYTTEIKKRRFDVTPSVDSSSEAVNSTHSTSAVPQVSGSGCSSSSEEVLYTEIKVEPYLEP